MHGHFWVLRNLVTLLTKYHHMVLFVSMIGNRESLENFCSDLGPECLHHIEDAYVEFEY